MCVSNMVLVILMFEITVRVCSTLNIKMIIDTQT